jgi:NAD(P)-dependent dehydrogenase (short-subunit alcohol dehydrogenase family)
MGAPRSKEFGNYPSLAGRTVFVTGGSSGIGADIVVAFARQGAKVGFTGRNVEAAAKVLADAKAVGPEPLFIKSDAADVAALRAAIAQTAAAFGDIGVLINNVANDQRHDIADVTPEDRLRPPFFAAQAVIDGMKRLGGGAIVNLGSISWMIKGAGYPIYATCKSAMQGLTRSLARDLGPHHIRVNTLSPGWVMTEKQLNMWVDPAGEKLMDDNQCLPGRIAGADVAQLALYLAAEDSRMVTAQDFIIDAGWT